MKNSFTINPRLYLMFLILSGILIGALIGDMPYISFICVLSLFVYFFLRKPLPVLAVFIILVPFSGTLLFREPFLNLPGAKPLHLLALFMIFIAIINHKQAMVIPKRIFWLMVLYLAFFSVTFMRSVPLLDIINLYDDDQLSRIRYVLSHYLKPMIYFIPFIIIMKYCKRRQDIDTIINVMVMSITFLSVYLLFSYLFRIPDRGDIRQVEEYYNAALGLHRNELGTFYIVGLPVILARFFVKKDVVGIFSICLSLAAVGFLYSRAAYFTVLFGIVIFLIISKRAKMLPLLLIIALGLSFIISATIIQRASKGFESRDSYELLAGRLEGIWLPLIDEYTRDPQKLIFGNGRYAILTSKAQGRGFILETGHPHNIFLELLLDAGLTGLIGITAVFAFLLLQAWRSLKDIKDAKMLEYQYAMCVSLICFLISGMTDRSFFPKHDNCFLWLVVGLSLLIIQNFRDPAGHRTR